MNRDRSITTLGILGSVLLLMGIALDMAWVRPTARRVDRLRVERSTVLAKIAEAAQSDRERTALAQALAIADLDSLEARAEAESPLGFIGRMLSASQLDRLDLTAMETLESVRLVRSRFSLRVLGKYSDMVDFLEALEAEPRLVTVDAISIEREMDGGRLECRLNVSIHDPKGKVS